MATKYDATIRLLMENRDFLRDARRSEGAIDNVADAGGRASSSFVDMGKRAALTFGAGGALAGILAWADAGADLALQARLVGRSMDEVLGPASDRLISKNEDLALQMGLTRAELEKSLLPFANVGASMGLAADENERYLGLLFNAAADQAAFNGEIGATAEILGAMESATRGEFDALQRYIPAISAAAVEQEALNMTGKDSADQLTDLEKLVAAYNIILQENVRAQGSANEAIEEGATATQAVNTEMREAQTTIGGAALVLKTAFFSALAGAINLLDTIGGAIARVLMWLDDLGDSGIPIVQDFAELLSQVGQMAAGIPGAFDRWKDAVVRLLAPVRRLGELLAKIPRNLPDVIGGIRGAVGRLPIPGFAGGGRVQGPTGVPQLAVVHGGEEIRTPQQQRAAGGGAGMIVNVTVNAGLADPQTTAREIVDLLNLYNRTNGALPISVEGS